MWLTITLELVAKVLEPKDLQVRGSGQKSFRVVWLKALRGMKNFSKKFLKGGLVEDLKVDLYTPLPTYDPTTVDST